MKLPGAILLASGLVLWDQPAVGQDALRSALTIEPVLGASPPVSELSSGSLPHLGPVQLETGAYTGLELNDNINSSQSEAKPDLLLRGGLNLGLLWPATSESNLHFNSNFGYVHYLRYSQYDHLEVAPTSALSWSIGLQDGNLAFFDQFGYSQQVLAESAISGLATFPRFNNSIGTQLHWSPGRCTFDSGYTHNDSFSDSKQFEYLNSSSEFFFVRAGWRFGDISQAGLEASSSLTSYQLLAQNGNYSISLGPYTDWQVTRSLHLSLRGGPVLYIFQSQPGFSQDKQLDAYYLGFEVAHQLTDFFTHKINLQRDVRQGLNRGSSYIEEFTATYSGSLSLTSKVELGVAVTYEQGTQPLEVPVNVFPFGTFLVLSTENYSRYGTTLNASWRVTNKLAANLAYAHWSRASNLTGLGYDVNTVSLNLSYTF